jgi:hypothetical protein
VGAAACLAPTHLGDPPDVLVAALLVEAQVLVEPKAHVVAVEAVRGQPEVQQVLLERRRDGRLARRREPCEPDGQPALLAQGVALVARERRMPGDVAAAPSVRAGGSTRAVGYGGAHVAIVSAERPVWRGNCAVQTASMKWCE